MASLYEINAEMLSCIDMETGEIIDEEKLNALAMERDEKIENIALWIKNLKSDIEQYKAEKKNFEDKIKSAANKVESLTNYLTATLNGQKFKTSKVSISYRKSDVIDICDINKIPGWFFEAQEPKILKAELKKAIKEGQSIEGAVLVTRSNMQIK